MLQRKELLLTANPWFGDIFADCQTEINILIVVDGMITFVESEFGLSELINKGLLPSVTPWEKVKIVKAHRASNGMGADICSFQFDTTPAAPYDFPLDHYDEIWLFGFESEKDSSHNPNPPLT